VKAFRIKAQENSGLTIEPLPLPSVYRKGEAPAEYFRQQARGEIPMAEQNLSPSRFMRSIVLDDGRVERLASEPGALLTFVISGILAFDAGPTQAFQLEPGDLFLADGNTASRLTVAADDTCRLIQIGVREDWPGPDAQLQAPGTLNPRIALEPNLKRVIKDVDDRAYLSEFPELFSAPANHWSEPRPLTGFRFMCWEDGLLDWHPEVINSLAIFLSGELEIETEGRGGGIEVFRAGDICLAEDRAGGGHIDRTRGATHVGLLVLETEDHW
jgi:hypothetical protein